MTLVSEAGQSFPDIREAVRRLCAKFPGPYWQELDRERAYPTEFVKELTDAAQVRDIVAYEEAHKNRHGVVSAAQARLAAIAQEVVGIN